MQPNFKTATFRSIKYLKFVRSRPCCICGDKIVQAHHEQPVGEGSMGSKVGDHLTIPLCFLHHRQRHDRGRSIFASWGVDPQIVINGLQRLWTDSGKAAGWA